MMVTPRIRVGARSGDCRIWKAGEQLLSGEIRRHGIETQVWRKLYAFPALGDTGGIFAVGGVKFLLEESCLW
jgi:hypothetical protein